MSSSEEYPYWSVPAAEVLSGLSASPSGLTPDQARQILQTVGPNAVAVRKQQSPLGLFANQFKSPIMLILLFATLVSLFVGDTADAVIILVILLGSSLLSFYQEFQASNVAAKLMAQVRIKTQVLRGGQEFSLPSEEVVPGDIVLLSAGSLIPADGLLLEAKDFFVSQSVLTGETFPVEKKPGTVPAGASLAERTNVVFMGTSVRSGTARALIVKTGPQTAYGEIAHRLTLRPPETEFERGLRHFGLLLTEVMLLLVFGIFAFNIAFHRPFLDSLLFSIALAVGLTPQLLPAIININLSKGSQAMAAAGVIVRRLASIENFGSMDVLCTDKTGTLTVGVVSLDGALDVDGQPSDRVMRCAYLNAHFQTGLANALDEAILHHGLEDLTGVEKVDEIPYDFVRKCLSVVVRDASGCTMLTKGALENVLALCAQVRAGGQLQPLDDAFRGRMNEKYLQWSEQGYRLLGVASRPCECGRSYERDDEKDLIFEGFLLFFDPPKPGAEQAVQELSRAGIQLKMITGDNHLVARHLADAIHLPVTGIVTGADLARMREEALWNIVQHANLFTEVDPNQKERIIRALQKTGHVVGYMGDGVNDAPALHSADVGISVEGAVDVAKEAAEFVLLRQDLGVLIQGIREGRKTFGNTLKYVFMATSANFGNMFSMAGASLFLPFLPMLPKQILLINFLTDLPEMTIAGDQVDEAFIRTPHRWDIQFIRRFMFVFGLLSSVFDYSTFAVLLWVIKATEPVFHTGWFVESILSAALVVFAIRTRLPFNHSRPSRAMLLITALVVVIVLALPYTPLGTLMGFAPLPLAVLALLVAIVLLYFLSAEMLKRWFYRHFMTR